MLVGHYATALVAKERNYDTPVWVFVVAATSLDFVMSALVLAGVETMAPDPSGAGSMFERMVADTPYSHDLVPVGFWALLAALFVYAFAKRIVAALWGGALVIFHELCDLVSGFGHHILGADTPAIGLALYSGAPLSALGIEFVLAIGCVWWFTSRTRLPAWRKIGLYLAVALGSAVMVPNVV